MKGVAHQETDPDGSSHVVSRLSCSLVGEIQHLTIIPGTKTHQAYNCESGRERFQCNYGLNEDFKERFNDGNFKISGVDQEGNTRIVELVDHPFFIATLFLPQLSATAEKPHPLILAFLMAALKQ